MNKIELENITFAVMAHISKALIEDFAQPADVTCRMLEDWTNDVIVVCVKQRIFGRQVLHDEISFPSDWKEAFKERWLPAWAKKRWPVCYDTHTFDVRELVPSLNIPGHRPFIVTTLGV